MLRATLLSDIIFAFVKAACFTRRQACETCRTSFTTFCLAVLVPRPCNNIMTNSRSPYYRRQSTVLGNKKLPVLASQTSLISIIPSLRRVISATMRAFGTPISENRRGKAQLSEEQKIEIVAKTQAGVRRVELAEEFNVCTKTITLRMKCSKLSICHSMQGRDRKSRHLIGGSFASTWSRCRACLNVSAAQADILVISHLDSVLRDLRLLALTSIINTLCL